MTGYDDRIKEQVQAANDIVDLISQYIPLKKSGKNFKACCPFHQEKTPSFMVHPEKQIFRCFGCGAGGDVFSFVMKHENLNFPEAMRQLADRAHITLPAVSKHSSAESTENEKLYEIYEHAVQFYHREFLDPVRGKIARDYFYSRHFDEAFARDFRIGWAPEEWKKLFEFLSKKGYPETLLLRSGLIHKSPKGTCYDAFRGRVLFPISNLQGKAVAFGGRILTDKKDGPKYLNSAENPIFHKREELYGLHLAKKFIDAQRPQIFVTEGYFDFLRLYQHGFRSAVATLGTALTEQHVRLLKRFAEEAVVIYDGDKAGQAASLRGLEVFLEGGMNVKLVRMPEGYDPDDYLDKYSAEAFRKLIDGAQDFFDFKLELLLEKFDRWDSLGLMKITNDFMETLVKVKNSFLLDRYLRKLGASLGVDENSLKVEIQKMRERNQKTAQPPAVPVKQAPEKKKLPQEELIIINLFVDDAQLRQDIVDAFHELDFSVQETQKLFQTLSAQYLEGKSISWPQFLSSIQDEGLSQSVLASAVLDWNADEKKKALEDCIQKVRSKRRQHRLDNLRRLIAQAEREGDQPRIGQYVQEYQTLLKEKV